VRPAGEPIPPALLGSPAALIFGRLDRASANARIPLFGTGD